MTSQRVEHGKQPASIIPKALQDAPRSDAPRAASPTPIPGPSTSLAPHHAEFAEFHESYVRHYIQFADTKAGVCFAAISAMLGYLISQDSVQKLILNPAWSLQFGALAAALVVLFIAAAFSFAVIAPRLNSKSPEGIVFFGAVADREKGEDYVADVMECSEADLTTARLKHCFDISKICDRKYFLLRAAIWSAMPGLLFALLAVLVTPV